MKDKVADDILKAGTGFMQTLSEAIRKLENEGYTDNLVACYDHFECRMGAIKIEPSEFIIDRALRFDNSSDPDDQSVLYAVSSPAKEVKGLYVDSYGTYHESLSKNMLDHLQESLKQDRAECKSC